MLVDQFILNNIAIIGQWTTIYGAPNFGKNIDYLLGARKSILTESIDGEMVFISMQTIIIVNWLRKLN